MLTKGIVSLIFAAVAALIVILTALASGARYSTVAVRALVSFILSGGLLFLAVFLFEKYEEKFGLPAWLDKRADAEAETEARAQDGNGVPGEGAVAGNPAPTAGQSGFTPLSEDNLKRVSAPGS